MQEWIEGDIAISSFNSAGAAGPVITGALKCDLADSGRLHVSIDWTALRGWLGSSRFFTCFGGRGPFSNIEPSLFILLSRPSLIHPLLSPDFSHQKDLNLHSSSRLFLTQDIHTSFYFSPRPNGYNEFSKA